MNRAAAIERLVERVAQLNPDAGEIGAGMLVQLVTDARRAMAMPPVEPALGEKRERYIEQQRFTSDGYAAIARVAYNQGALEALLHKSRTGQRPAKAIAGLATQPVHLQTRGAA